MALDNPTIFEHEDADGDRLTVDRGSLGVVLNATTWLDDVMGHVTAAVAVRHQQLPDLIAALQGALNDTKEA